jgi:hypothetical protein
MEEDKTYERDVLYDLQQVKQDLTFDMNRELGAAHSEWLELGGENSGHSLQEWNAPIEAFYNDKIVKLPTADIIINSGLSVEEVLNLPKKKNLNVQFPRASRSIIYGEVEKVPGVLTFITTDQPASGSWIHMVLTFTGHEVEDLVDFYFDDDLFTHDESYPWTAAWGTGDWQIPDELLPPAPYVRQASDAYAFVSKSLGDPDQVANANLVSQSDLLFPGKWTANHRQRGCAHAYFIFLYYPPRFPYAFPPKIYAKVKGRKVYDPREGGHTFGDESTYEYSNNAALCIADYLTNTQWGLGASEDEVDWDNIDAAADVCDESVTLQLGSESRYTMNGLFKTSESPQNILQKMANTIGGQILYRQQKWQVFPAEWRAPTITLTSSDLTGPYKLKSKSSRRDAINAVRGADPYGTVTISEYCRVSRCSPE